MNRPKKNSESGFALLLVFAMAATVAMMLYIELPRAVFESQRAKESLLVERGEQYQRAIQVYFRKFRKYPARIEELESTNNVRFLRRRYTDPMTGKDDWRLIHIGPAGEFVDSAVHKPKPQTKDEKAENRNPQSTDPALAAAEGPVGIAFRQRPSDKMQPSASGEYEPGQQPGQSDPNAPQPPPGSNVPIQSGAQFPGQFPGQVSPFPGQPGTYPGQPGAVATAPTTYPTYAPPFPADPPQQQPNTQQQNTQISQQFPGLPGQVPFPQGQFPGQILPGQPRRSSESVGQGGSPFQGGNFPIQGAPMPGYPTSAVNSQTGGVQQPNPNVNPALDLIRNLLTTPRPGGLTGGAQPSAPGFTGGIAGVASKYESRGIKLINERDKIHEWEFLYDFRQDRNVAGRLGAAGGTGSVVGFPTAPPTMPGNPQSGFMPGGSMTGSPAPGGSSPGGLPPGSSDSRGIRGRGRQ